MKKGRMAEIVKELQGASKMHLKQSKEIEEHIDDMKSPAKMSSPLNKGDRTGDSVSWKYGKGTYSGTCLNASCSRARTKNGKVKILPQNRGK
jgi:hypothetical protein